MPLQPLSYRPARRPPVRLKAVEGTPIRFQAQEGRR